MMKPACLYVIMLGIMAMGLLACGPKTVVQSRIDDEAMLRSYERFAKMWRGNVGGIGVNLNVEIKGSDITVASTIANSQAARAGIKAGDRITMIDNQPTKGMTPYEAAEIIAGGPSGAPIGSTVNLTVKHQDSAEAETVTLVRERFYCSINEEVRKYRVQAEFALEQKRFNDAIRLYSEGCKIAPCWADGHFNIAIILAELGEYHTAIREMKIYLILVPDAQDAREVQDKIYQWESLIK